MPGDHYIQHLKGLAVYQVLGGAGGLLLSGQLLGNFSEIQPGYWILVLLPVVFYLFSIYAGISLWRRDSNSLRLTIINQALQLVSVSGPTITYLFVSGGALLLRLDVSYGIRPNFGLMLSSFRMYLGGDTGYREVGINLAALGIIVFVVRTIKDIAKQKMLDQIDSIGASGAETALDIEFPTDHPSH